MNIDHKTLVLRFDSDELVKKNYSQAAQDIFVLCCLNGEPAGTFLDLGCHHPTDINNTYLLEDQFFWRGVSIDISAPMIELYTCRNTVSLNEDCTRLDFDKIIALGQTHHFDYLSLDLEPASVTLDCLTSIPFDKIEFSLITYEHDSYRFGEQHTENSRKIIEKHGYKRICSNVSNGGNIYEDWYYNPKYVSYERIKILESANKEWRDILFKQQGENK